MTKNDMWFRPRRFGWGMTPARWQGWALTIGCIVAIVTLMRAPLPDWLRNSGAIVMLAVFITIAAARTDGPLRWRWGRD